MVFELALCKLLAGTDSLPPDSHPISLYCKPIDMFTYWYTLVAPLKSLCSERMSGWRDKLNALGYNCLELTSDSPNYDLEELLACSVFIATP